MDSDVAVMWIALRVLNASIKGTSADETDLAELRKYLPMYADLPVDVLACEVVQKAIENRKRATAAVGS